jgi:hypothetical protein
MKKYIFLGIALILVIVLVTLAMTKPDRAAHYDAVKGLALKTVDHELSSNPLTAEYTAVGNMVALNFIDEYLKRNLLLREHTFYTSGVLMYNDMFIPISIGVFGQVYLTVDENDLKQVVAMPEMQQILDLKNILK